MEKEFYCLFKRFENTKDTMIEYVTSRGTIMNRNWTKLFLKFWLAIPPGKQEQALGGFPIKSKQVNKREKLIFLLLFFKSDVGLFLNLHKFARFQFIICPLNIRQIDCRRHIKRILRTCVKPNSNHLLNLYLI